MFFLGKYATASTFEFPMVKRGVVDLASSGDWTPAQADSRLVKDGSSIGPSTNTIANIEGPTWKLALSSGEMTAAEISVNIVDSATKAVEDQWFKIYTYGNASAKYVIDFSDAVHFGLTGIPNAAAGANGGLPTVDASNAVKVQTGTSSGQIALSSGTVTVGTNSDKTGYSIANGGIANTAFAAGAIDAAAIAADAIGASEIAADAIGASELAADAVTEIWAKACTEPTAVVAASPTAIAAMSWLLTLSRNKITQTASVQTLLADDGLTTIAASTVSDDSSVFTRGEFA